MRRQVQWGFWSLLALAGSAQAAEPVPDPLLPVATGEAGSSRDIRGVLHARDQAMLSSELAGRILEMPFAEGQPFKKGDVLVRFDCSAYQAQLNAAQAGVRAASEELSHNRQLAALNSVGRYEVALAEARQAEAQAQAQVYQVQVRRCGVQAPYDGQVVQRKAQPFESVASGAPLLEIVDNRSLEIRLLPTNFSKAYNDYLGCTAKLLPVNYDQVKQATLGFPGGGAELDDTTRAKLDIILQLVKADPSINRFSLDGYSDNSGNRLSNRDLSRRRALAVEEYLKANGIGEEQITVRFYGEQYPLVPNTSAANREKNRRVTLHLSRETAPSKPPEPAVPAPTPPAAAGTS